MTLLGRLKLIGVIELPKQKYLKVDKWKIYEKLASKRNLDWVTLGHKEGSL